MDEPTTGPDLIGMTADIVSAYVSKNKVDAAGLPNVITSVYGALAGAAEPPPPEPEPQKPAVSIRKSITPDFLISLEDGRPYKSLKRHLETRYGLTPDQYRAKWGLPADYPMVAPNYAKIRSEMARSMGLGAGGRRAPKRTRKVAAN